MESSKIVEKYLPNLQTGTDWHGKYKHLMYCPFTGLGLYDGFRGNKWLKERVQIFKQFVVPSLQAQTSKDFTLWVSWRPEERRNPIVKDLMAYLSDIKEFETVHTFSGVCFWDDKYPPEVARDRLLQSLHGAMSELIDVTTGEHGYEWVLMTIQPSDDCYHKNAVKGIQGVLRQDPKLQAFGFSKGYLMNYQTKELAEWNPENNPPFYTIKFPRPIFIDPLAHAKHTALKQDVGEYKAGTPLPSHEYVKYCLNYGVIPERGFLVGTHGANISTVFNHPYKGEDVKPEILEDFGLGQVEKLKLRSSIRREIFKRLPYKAQRKLRYLAGEKKWTLRPVFNWLYNFLRS